MINQRQGGRRRGRGGQRGQNLGGQPGNRQDNRQRGNAAQLLEKYKSMARDAQLAGDRVQTEYYLQYADHYFRVLSENRARFEDQNPQRRPRDDEFDGDDGDELETPEAESQGDDRQDRGDRGERFNRRDRGRDRDREPRRYREERSADQDRDDEETSARVNGEDGDSLPLDVLPPSIGADAPPPLTADEDEKPAKPRRRSRTARPADGDEEVAPAV